MKKISLGNELFALVDNEDYPKLSGYKWHLHSKACASRCVWDGKRVGVVLMHRQIMGDPTALVDHIDRNPLNNQKRNLRVCDAKGNARNRGPSRNSKSGYKGVHWAKHCKRWIAQIEIDGKNRYLGAVKDKLGAVLLYDMAAAKYFGEFAYFNTIPCDAKVFGGCRK